MQEDDQSINKLKASVKILHILYKDPLGQY